MQIGKELRELREEKGLSQGHIEDKTGLLRCYVSRKAVGLYGRIQSFRVISSPAFLLAEQIL
jgi:transcriptional regulator with XRE-family HTH domain